MTKDLNTEKGNAVLAAVIASFTGSQSDKSEAVLAALTSVAREGELSRDELRAKATALADAMEYSGDVESIVNSVIDNTLYTARLLLSDLVEQIGDDIPSDDMSRHFRDALNDAKQFLGIAADDDYDDDDDDDDDDGEGV